MTVFQGSVDVADALFDELRALGFRPSSARGEMPVIVSRPAPTTVDVDPVFARQTYPHAVLVEAADVSELCQGLLLHLGDASPPEEGVEVAVLDLARRGSAAVLDHPLAVRAAAVQDTLQKKLAGRRAQGKLPPLTRHRLLVLLTSPTAAWCSVVKHQHAEPLVAWPATFVGGKALQEATRDAPSSAHRKIDEATCWLGCAPGATDLVVDLGAAPGGWSSVALAKGARVIAVDRADLDAQVARHPRLRHERKDAFNWEPQEAPTWLFCDVIADPGKSLAVAHKALGWPSLRALIVTLKLKNPIDYGVLQQAQALAAQTPGFVGRCKHLVANKLEVTLMMKRDDDEA